MKLKHPILKAAFLAAFFMTLLVFIPKVIWGEDALALPSAGVQSQTFVWEDFELGTSYWGTQFEASVMDGGTLSSDFPTSGSYGYRGHFLLGKGGGRAAFSTSQVGDLTGATSLTVDFYNSSSITFTGSVILKQGAAWTWLNSHNITLIPGWNRNVVFDLSTLTPKSDIKQAGIVFESKQEGEGFLYMDNLRLTGADPAKVGRLTAADLATGNPVLVTGFEDGANPFAPDTVYSTAVDSSVKVTRTTEGTHAGYFYYENKQPDDKATFVLEADMDLTSATGVVFDAFVPGNDPVDAMLALNTGAKWDYFESAPKTLNPGWNRNISFSMNAKTFKSATSGWNNTGTIQGLSVVRKFGLCFSSHQIGKSFVAVDNIRLLTNDTPGLEKIVRDAVPFNPPLEGMDRLLEGFEKKTTSWVAQVGTYKSTAATIVASKSAAEGSHMLKVAFEFDGDGQQAWYGFDQNDDMNLSDSSAVKVDIYNPLKETLSAGMVLKTGEAFEWMEANPVNVKPGWNRDVTFYLKSKSFKTALSQWKNSAYATNLEKVKSIYLGFYHNGPLTGTAYLDNIRVTGTTEVKMGQVSAPRGEVTGRSILWDPLFNASADGWGAQTNASSNSFAVVSTYFKHKGEYAVDLRYRTFAEDQAAQFVKNKFVDWTNVEAVQFDFFNPQSYSVIFTLAVQTGPQSEWQESTEISLKPGWNRNVRVNISQPIFKSVQTNWSSTDFLRDRDDIRTVIVNLHPHQKSPSDGHVIMTNLRTIERDLVGSATGSEQAGQLLGVTSETQLTVRALKYTLFESFEGNIQPWQPSAGAVLNRSTSYSTDGNHSLEVDYQCNFGAGAAVLNPIIAYIPPGKTFDVSSYSHFEFDAFNPGQPLVVNLQFLTGPPYNGNSSGEDIESQSVTIFTGWNHNLDIALLGNNFKTAATAWRYWDTLRNANQVHQMTFKISGYAGLPGRGTFYLDNLRWVGSGTQQVDGVAGETLSFKFNPSDAIQLQVQSSVMGTQNGPAQFNLDKVRLDVRAGGNELALFTGDQVSGSGDPMQLLSGPSLGNQIFGVEDRYSLDPVGVLQATGFAQYGSTPNTLGSSAGYMFRFKSISIEDSWIGAGLLDGRYGNVPGSNPLTSNVEADIQTYEVDINSYIKDIHLQILGEVAESLYDAYPGSAYFMPQQNNQAYDIWMNYQIGAFKFTAGRTVNQLSFFMPYEVAGAAAGAIQNNFQIYWATDQLSLIQDMENWSPFWSNFLNGLNLNIQYYDYASMSNTNSNYGIRTILTNNTDKSPLNMNFWWYIYDDGYDVGDPTLANPSLATRALQITSHYELRYKITPQFLVSGIFRDTVTDWWEVFTYDAGLNYKFWGNTWVSGDAKFVNQTGFRYGQFTNITASLKKYFLDNSVLLALTYGLPSFSGYWEDDSNLQTLDMWQFSLTGKF